MKIKRRLISFGTALALVVSMSAFSIGAEEPEIGAGSDNPAIVMTTGNNGLTTDPGYLEQGLTGMSETAEPNGAYKPVATWNLATDGLYDFSGMTSLKPLYTNYLFKGSITMGIGVHSIGNNDVIVRVYKKGIVSDTEIANFTVPANGYKHYAVNGLDASAKYYVRFGYPSTVEGYVNEVVVPNYFN